jgi:phospholipid/cholesterol/gamma-HCH transport system substrate-binding protein
VKTEAKVGLFVVVSAAILLVSVYRISTATIRGAHVSYKTYFRYAGGLEPGADVLFGGIKVGNVTAVRPDAADPTRIEILMDVKTGTPLNANSVAKLGSVTLVTSPVISISTGSNDAARIPPGGVIPSQETVALDDMERKFATLADSAHSVLSSAEKDMNDVTGDARRLIANLNEITGKPNQQHIEAILTNAEGMINRISPKIDQIADRIQKVADDADQVVAKAGPLMDNANATVSNASQTITDVREPVQKDLADLSKTLDQARGLIGELRASMRAKDQDFTYTLENVRLVTDNLNELTESLKQRPWSLIRIRQSKDRKVPQIAKAQP